MYSGIGTSLVSNTVVLPKYASWSLFPFTDMLLKRFDLQNIQYQSWILRRYYNKIMETNKNLVLSILTFNFINCYWHPILSMLLYLTFDTTPELLFTNIHFSRSFFCCHTRSFLTQTTLLQYQTTLLQYQTIKLGDGSSLLVTRAMPSGEVDTWHAELVQVGNYNIESFVIVKPTEIDTSIELGNIAKPVGSIIVGQAVMFLMNLYIYLFKGIFSKIPQNLAHRTKSWDFHIM